MGAEIFCVQDVEMKFLLTTPWNGLFHSRINCHQPRFGWNNNSLQKMRKWTPLDCFSLLQRLSVHFWPLKGGGKPCKNPFKKIEVKKHKNLTGNALKSRMQLREHMLIISKSTHEPGNVSMKERKLTRKRGGTGKDGRKRELTRWNGKLEILKIMEIFYHFTPLILSFILPFLDLFWLLLTFIDGGWRLLTLVDFSGL
jgi:hypothetical protein